MVRDVSRLVVCLLALSAVALVLGCQTSERPKSAPSAPAPKTEAAAPAPKSEAPKPAVAESEAAAAARKLGTATTNPVVTTATGLQYIEVKEGGGEAAQAGKTVSVHYTGWLVNGTEFDNSLDRGRPIEFVLGTGRVIRGWEEGVAGMKVGGIRKLIIPPDLGYGSRAMGPIPAGSTLIFEVQLVAVR
jgi:peptidylprolyl isomerase